MKQRHPAGFTLLEVLVALVVFGFLFAGLTQGIEFGVRAHDMQVGMLARQGGLEPVDRVLRQIVTLQIRAASRSRRRSLVARKALIWSPSYHLPVRACRRGASRSPFWWMRRTVWFCVGWPHRTLRRSGRPRCK